MMRSALYAVEPTPAPRPEQDHPLYQLLEQGDPDQGVAGNGGFRFWACAHGPEGSSQTTAVWGLWLDQAVVFAADTESIAVGDPRTFPASVVQLEDDGAVRVVDGSAERVDDPALLGRFASECEAKYGFEPDPDDPDTPVYTVRSIPLDSEQAAPTQ
jgi:hypothetical protein